MGFYKNTNSNIVNLSVDDFLPGNESILVDNIGRVCRVSNLKNSFKNKLFTIERFSTDHLFSFSCPDCVFSKNGPDHTSTCMLRASSDSNSCTTSQRLIFKSI